MRVWSLHTTAHTEIDLSMHFSNGTCPIKTSLVCYSIPVWNHKRKDIIIWFHFWRNSRTSTYHLLSKRVMYPRLSNKIILSDFIMISFVRRSNYRFSKRWFVQIRWSIFCCFLAKFLIFLSAAIKNSIMWLFLRFSSIPAKYIWKTVGRRRQIDRWAH